MDLIKLMQDASDLSSDNFIETLDKATTLLRSEQGRIGNFTVNNHLITLEPSGEALVIGDLHGNLESLQVILKTSKFIDRLTAATKDSVLIFLGDYGDRGNKSAEVYFAVLQLKLAFPGQVVLLRGNHEGPPDLMASPHDLPTKFQAKFGENGKFAYQKTRALWSHLYNAVYVPDSYLMVHGGVSPEINSLNDIADADENRNKTVLEDLLWSDPDEDVQDFALSPRGIGKLFGKVVTEAVLRRVNAKILIRGHEANDAGFKINHNSKVLTLFSRKGAPYFNKYGAYLQMALSEKTADVNQLVPFIHKF